MDATTVLALCVLALAAALYAGLLYPCVIPRHDKAIYAGVAAAAAAVLVARTV